MTRKQAFRLVAVAATVTISATTVLIPAVADTGSARPAADRTVLADDTAITSTVAPVLKNGKSHRYSAGKMRQIDAEGGDPDVLNYWTPKRMAEAKSLDQPGDRKLVDERAQSLAANPASIEAFAAGPVETFSHPVAPSGPQPLAQRRLPITTGKLFIGGFDSGSWCSASALNTSSRRVILTAGHCLHSGPGGGWRRNLVFVPMYRGHADWRAPYGKFQVATMHAFQGWTRNGYFSRDVGFATTYRNESGKRVVGAVGGNGLRTGGAFRYTATIFGYPANLEDGDRMQRCRTYVRWNNRPRGSVARGCRYGSGASGGPWVWQYRTETGLGYSRGVTSWGPSGSVAYIGSPHFDRAVRDLAAAANRAF